MGPGLHMYNWWWMMIVLKFTVMHNVFSWHYFSYIIISWNYEVTSKLLHSSELRAWWDDFTTIICITFLLWILSTFPLYENGCMIVFVVRKTQQVPLRLLQWNRGSRWLHETRTYNWFYSNYPKTPHSLATRWTTNTNNCPLMPDQYIAI